MTIKDFYEWAVKNGCENYEFGISLQEEAELAVENENLDPCYEIKQEDLKIDGWYDKPFVMTKPFVWADVWLNEDK